MLRLLLGIAISAALLVSGHALVWRWMGSQMQAGFGDWVATRRGQGWRIAYGAPQQGGWPFAVTLTLPDFHLEGGNATLPGGLAWQVEQLRLQVRLPRLDRLVVEPLGRNRLRLAGLELPFAADRLAVTVPLERNVLPSEAVVDLERLRLATPAGPLELRRGELSIEARLTATEGEPALHVTFSGEDLLLPPLAPGLVPLGRQLARLTLDAAVTGPVPPGRGPMTKAEAWRDGGGTLDLRSLELDWGNVAASSTATLTLDEQLQPMGAGSLKLRNAGAVVEAASAAGLLTPRAATAARAAARLLSRVPPEGGAPQLEVPLTLEERVLTVSRFPIARLPAWAWPAPPALPDAAQDPSLPARD